MTRSAPEFDQRPTGDNDILQLHQYLIGLRRRQSWLHTAHTEAVEVSNTGYVYRTVADGHELTVALNIGDDPLPVALPRPGRITAGSGAPTAGARCRSGGSAARMGHRRAAVNWPPGDAAPGAVAVGSATGIGLRMAEMHWCATCIADILATDSSGPPARSRRITRGLS